MGLPASSSSSAQLLLHFAYFLLSLSLDAPNTKSVAAAASPFFFSFDFTNTSSYRLKDLRIEGSASVHSNLIDLTCNSFGETIEDRTGRMSYRYPVPFYDDTTREVASFSTRFTFAIKFNTNNINSQTSSTAYKPTSHTRGDGMAFFLAYYPSSMPPHSGGGKLGLFEGEGTTAWGDGQFVAVEFDTFNNPSWDPSDTSDHIGIDISSMRSVNTTSLLSLKGSMTASITFDNTTRMLVASLQFADKPSAHPVEVSTKLPDPQTFLPSEVAVGFSASTGSAVELHQIMSWSFNSTLAPPPKGTSHDKKATIIGGSIGGASVSALLVWLYKWISKRYAFEKRTGVPRRFDQYRDLAAATDDFSEQNSFGQGALGVVDRGTSLKGLNEKDGEVAVKKISKDSKEGHADFFPELNTIGATNPKNLVNLKEPSSPTNMSSSSGTSSSNMVSSMLTAVGGIIPTPAFGHLITIKLTQENYLLWKAQILPYLRSQQLLGYVDGTAQAPTITETTAEGANQVVNPEYQTWVQQDQLVLSYLLSSLSPEVLAQVLLLPTAKDVWTTLEHMFSSQSRARIMQIRLLLSNTKKEELSVAEYFRKMKSFADTMASAGKPLEQDEFISYVLAGLDPEYNLLVTFITTRTDPISTTDLYEHLLSFEMMLERQGLGVLQNSNAQQFSGSSANAAMRGGGRGYRGRGRSSGGRQGDYGGQMRQGDGNKKHFNTSSGGNRPTCQVCGKIGHSALKCYAYQSEEPRVAAMANTVTGGTGGFYNIDTNWYADTGASDHITNDLDRLTMREKYQGNDQVDTASGSVHGENSAARQM